jgi:hypothetical protein
MTGSSNTDIKKICQYCHSYIKDKDDMLLCPECNSPYHIECWYENEGCGAYGCNYRIKIDDKRSYRRESLEEMLVSVEFHINNNHFIDAINLCRRILSIESENIEAKKFFNKAITLENTKQHLIESGETAFKKEDLIGAELYFIKALKYTDEIESDLIRTKLQILKEKYPVILKRRRRNRIISNLIGLLIVLSLGFLLYYNVFMKEEREFYAIDKDDNTADITKLEQQISRYEKFLIKYKNSEYNDEVNSKISILSSVLADRIVDNDWRSALKYLQKIDSNVNITAYKDISKRVFVKAEEEFRKYMKKSVESDRNRNFADARTNLEKCLAIAEQFSEGIFAKEKVKITDGINLLGRKISSALKQKEVYKELSEKSDEYSRLGNKEVSNSVNMSFHILAGKNNGYYICRNLDDNKIFALKSPGTNYLKGDLLNFDCYRKGSTSIEYNNSLKEMPVYVTLESSLFNTENDKISSSFEKEALLQRIKYLREQINRLDSILNLKLF